MLIRDRTGRADDHVQIMEIDVIKVLQRGPVCSTVLVEDPDFSPGDARLSYKKLADGQGADVGECSEVHGWIGSHAEIGDEHVDKQREKGRIKLANFCTRKRLVTFFNLDVIAHFNVEWTSPNQDGKRKLSQVKDACVSSDRIWIFFAKGTYRNTSSAQHAP